MLILESENNDHKSQMKIVRDELEIVRAED